MRWNEIISEFTRPSTIQNAASILKNAGWTQLGSGNYAEVYHKADASYVLKLFSTEDRAYRDFVKVVQQNPNPHFPKFQSKLIKVTPDYFAIKMEKLEPFGDKSVLRLIRNYLGYLSDDELVRLDYHWPGKQDDSEEKEAFKQKHQASIDYMDNNPTLKTACDIIADKLLDRYNVDLFHSDNIMLRGNILVLSDPIADV